MLNVFPKIDEEFLGFFKVKEYVKDGVEIQMTTTDICNTVDVIDKVVMSVPEIKEITLHAPMVYCDIEKNFDSKDRLNYMFSLIKTAVAISKLYSIRINVLFHCSQPFSYFQKTKQLWLFRKVINMIRYTRVYLLLENTMERENTKTGKEPVISTVKMLRSNKVQICFDLCHAHAVINHSKEEKELLDIYSDAKLGKLVRQIHFSATWNNDGLKDINTHSQYHLSEEDLQRDIEILEKLGLDKANIVVETLEDDYSIRENQSRELKLIEKVYKVI